MPDRARVFVVTGDEVVRLTLSGTRAHDAQTVLEVTAPQSVAVDPRDPNRVYVGTFDDGLYATDDGGETWREAWEGIVDARVMAISVSPSHQAGGISVVYAGTEPSNLYRSEDGGKTWQLLPELGRLPSEPRWSFPPRPGPTTCARSRCTRRIPTRSSSGSSSGRDALVRRRRHLDRPQPGGAQRRAPASDAPARARPRVRGRRPGDRGVARSGRELAPAGRRPRPPLRVGDRRDPVDPDLGTPRSAADRTPPTAAATASRCCCDRAGTAGRRSIVGATIRRCGGCRTRWRPCPDNRIGCWSGSAAERCW